MKYISENWYVKASSLGELQWQFHLFTITHTSIRTHTQLVYFFFFCGKYYGAFDLTGSFTRQLLSITESTEPRPWEAKSYGASEKTNPHHFIESEGSLPCSHEPGTNLTLSQMNPVPNYISLISVLIFHVIQIKWLHTLIIHGEPLYLVAIHTCVIVIVCALYLNKWSAERCRSVNPIILVYIRVTADGTQNLLLTYSWSWALLEEPPTVQLLKNFSAFYGTRRFFTVFTRVLHWSLS
jgi:hypothetical protein